MELEVWFPSLWIYLSTKSSSRGRVKSRLRAPCCLSAPARYVECNRLLSLYPCAEYTAHNIAEALAISRPTAAECSVKAYFDLRRLQTNQNMLAEMPSSRMAAYPSSRLEPLSLIDCLRRNRLFSLSSPTPIHIKGRTQRV